MEFYTLALPTWICKTCGRVYVNGLNNMCMVCRANRVYDREKGPIPQKIVLNEVCCKVNKEIKNIKRCNSYEEAEIKKEEVVEEKIEEIKPEPKIEEPKKEIRKIAEGRRKKR